MNLENTIEYIESIMEIDPEQATSLLQSALNSHNHNLRLYWLDGWLKYFHRNYVDALSSLKKAENIQDSQVRWKVHFISANCYEGLGQYLAAIRSYQYAYEIAPHELEILENLAFVYAKLGNLVDAEEVAQKALKIGKSPKLYRIMVEIAIVTSKIEEAEYNLRLLKELEENSVEFRFAKALTKTAKRDFDTAIGLCAEVMQASPYFLPAYKLILEINRTRLIPDDKIEVWLAKSSQLKHWTGYELSQIYAAFAKYYLTINQIRKAGNLFWQSVNSFPQNPYAQLGLGIVAMKNWKPWIAHKFFEQAVALYREYRGEKSFWYGRSLTAMFQSSALTFRLPAFFRTLSEVKRFVSGVENNKNSARFEMDPM